MATISYDGQSLILAGRRIWLVSGAIHYGRVPQPLWRSRIRAAKQAGLNCIDTPVFWNLHEPVRGRFNFEGDLNLRQFIQTVGEEGMHCILRPGPYVGAGCDLGGLPAWLLDVKNIRLRQANGPFLEACSRYLGQVMTQVKDLQATSSNGGPIVMIGAENHWFCDNPDQAKGYLVEITRYLRQNGADVPIIECNNLWSSTESTIAGWTGNDNLTTNLRQLRVVQPDAPRFLAEYETCHPDHWGDKPNHRPEPWSGLRDIASALAVGAQVNLAPFHSGTNVGFLGGRTTASRSSYITTSHAAPLGETGEHGPRYLAAKRIGVFASQFSQLLAHLNPDDQHTAVAIDGQQNPLSVIHQRGSQGQVIFLFNNPKAPVTHTTLLLPNGLTLPVPIGQDEVAWLALEADLGGVATLNYTNLRPWAFLDRQALVVFGPAGADGVVAINNAVLWTQVPTGKTPVIMEHEDLRIIVLNHEQLDAAYLSPTGMVIGTAGLDDDDQPIPLKGWPRMTTIHPDGTKKHKAVTIAKRPNTPRLNKWQQARLTALTHGTSDTFTEIDGPASLETLGDGAAYGWYRLTSIASKGQGAKLLAPQWADRSHIYRKGKLVDILGQGPGAQSEPTNLHVNDQTVVLADNLGRFSQGWRMEEPKGLAGHLYCVKPIKPTGLKIVKDQPAPDLFALGGFFPYAHVHDLPPCDVITWKSTPAGKNPLIVELDGLPWRAMLFANDEPVGAYDPQLSAGFGRFVLEVGQTIGSKTNLLSLALFKEFGPDEIKIKKLPYHLRIYQATGNLTDKAQWSFAQWCLPDDDEFTSIRKSAANGPCWYRCTFKVSRVDTPLWLEPAGMTKGQIYINGHNAGRYFVNTHTGQTVGPQKRYYLPEPWLHTDEPNELLIFDEHGKHPDKCRLVYS